MTKTEKEESLHKLSNMISDWYMSNDFDIYDLMFFLASSTAAIIAQKQDEFDYDNFVTQIKRMVKIIKDDVKSDDYLTITSQK